MIVSFNQRDCAEVCVLSNVDLGDINDGIIERGWSAMVGRGRDCAEACVLSNVHQGDFNDGIVRERVVCHCGKRYHLDAGYVQIPVGAGTDYKIF